MPTDLPTISLAYRGTCDVCDEFRGPRPADLLVRYPESTKDCRCCEACATSFTYRSILTPIARIEVA